MDKVADSMRYAQAGLVIWQRWEIVDSHAESALINSNESGGIPWGSQQPVTCGVNDTGQCDIPSLPDGVVYDQVAAGWTHVVLLKSDGTATTCGKIIKGHATFRPWRQVSFTHMLPQALITRYC